MNSELMKVALMKYYRFNRGMLVASEVNSVANTMADLMICDESASRTIEVEVKVSMSDFKADFKYKPLKHKYLKQSNTASPTNFYFAVPKDLEEKALEVLKDHPEYGLIVLSGAYGQIIHTKKRAKVLPYTGNTEKNNEEIKRTIIFRLASEVTNLKDDLYTTKQKLKEVKNAK